MGEPTQPGPSRGWVVAAGGTAVNLCLGILYAWSARDTRAQTPHWCGVWARVRGQHGTE